MCSVFLPFILRRRSRIQSVRSFTELQPTQSLIKCNVMSKAGAAGRSGRAATVTVLRIPYWTAEAVTGTRPSRGGVSSVERNGFRAEVTAFAATPLPVPDLPALLAAGAALVPEGS